MRLTKFTDYALRVLIYLGAHRNSGQFATIGDIAIAYRISENHLMKVVHHLAKQGYIETIRGNGGGMRLARAPERINVGAIVRDAEKDFALVECFHKGSAKCPIMPVCTLQTILGHAMSAFLKVLDGKTLEDLLKPQSTLVKLLRNASLPG